MPSYPAILSSHRVCRPRRQRPRRQRRARRWSSPLPRWSSPLVPSPRTSYPRPRAPVPSYPAMSPFRRQRRPRRQRQRGRWSNPVSYPYLPGPRPSLPCPLHALSQAAQAEAAAAQSMVEQASSPVPPAPCPNPKIPLYPCTQACTPGTPASVPGYPPRIPPLTLAPDLFPALPPAQELLLRDMTRVNPLETLCGLPTKLAQCLVARCCASAANPSWIHPGSYMHTRREAGRPGLTGTRPLRRASLPPTCRGRTAPS